MVADGPRRLAEIAGSKGVRDERLLAAIGSVPRADSVPSEHRHRTLFERRRGKLERRRSVIPAHFVKLYGERGLAEDG